ncbi:histidine phosphatase family protein [Streptomyces sp. NPDC058308]|uniref:histidine phosphatase family protein n=1 Tax=Streptomyces sp. NPDC058308 TaxID=3346440 RepID=UPI0036E82C24
MTTRVLLVAPALTAAARRGVFGDGEPLDPAGAAQTRRAAGTLPTGCQVLVSPGARCAQTADALGLGARLEAPSLAGLDPGRWRGRSLEEVSAAEPQAVGRWLTEPEAAAPGGESVADVCSRVAEWLDALRADTPSGRVVAVVEPEVVRAAAVHATGAPLSAFWRFDVLPLSTTELSGRSGRWNMRLGCPLGAA